jgi:hypothetical protein
MSAIRGTYTESFTRQEDGQDVERPAGIAWQDTWQGWSLTTGTGQIGPYDSAEDAILALEQAGVPQDVCSRLLERVLAGADDSRLGDQPQAGPQDGLYGPPEADLELGEADRAAAPE